MEAYWLILLVVMPAFVEGSSVPECPNGWVGYGNSCYGIFVHSRSVPAKTWEDASTYCKSFGGDLLSIGSREERNFIKTQVNVYGYVKFWIGLYRNSSGTIPTVGWGWTDGTDLKYTNWAWREPNNYKNSEKCGEIYGNSGYWNDNDCKEERSSICERQKGLLYPTVITVSTVPFITPKPEVICDFGWNAFRKSCYKIFDIKRTWDRAKTGCSSFGGHLLKIDDQTELDYFHNDIKHNYHGRYWIGLSDPQRNGNWQWVSDDSAPNVTSWFAGEPNGRGSETCVEMYGGRLAPFWNDQSCYVITKYICEKDGGKPGCPDDWTTFGDNCYQFNLAESQLKNWSAAGQACKSVGDFSSLVSILNKDEQSFLTKEIATISKSAVWIGLNDRQSENVYKWSDNSKVDYQNWVTKIPAAVNRPWKDCTVLLGMRTDGVWTMESCAVPRRYICKRKKALFDCDAPLGMENGNIGDDQILAKNSLSNSKGPLNARLRSNGTWCPKNKDDYLQIDLGSIYKIRKIAVQGYATLYYIEYGIDGKAFKPYSSTSGSFENLRSEASEKPHYIKNLDNFVARFIRITPLEGRNKCTRLELYGCLSESTITKKHRQAKWKKIPSTSVQYQINHIQLSWRDARSFCLEQKADLLSMSTPVIARYMIARLNMLRSFSFWIGLNDQDYPSMFYWSDGSPVNYVDWSTSTPSTGSYDCVQYRKYRSSWRTSNCNDKRPFVCMKKDPAPKRINSGVVGNGVTGVWMSSATHYWPLSSVDNGKLSGTVTGQAFGNIAVKSGVKNKSSSSLEFSKSGMYIDIPFADQDCITFPDVCPLKHLTLSFMASFDNVAASWNDVVILDSLGGNENNSTGISVYINKKKLWFVVSYVNLYWKMNIPIEADNAMRHYVLTCAANAINIHVNGKMIRSRAYVPTRRKPIHSKNLKMNMHIGLQPNSNVKSGAVRLSMLAFWDSILTEKDIQAIYKTEFAWCPNGWTAFGMSCYLFTSDSLSWAGSRSECQALGGDLATISSPVEQALITGRIQKSSWIGLKASFARIRQSRRRRYFWSIFRSSRDALSFFWANSAPVVYTNWRSHTSFSFRSTPTCTSVTTVVGTWAQMSCSTGFASVCEKEKVETKPTVNTTGVNRPKFTRVCQFSRDDLSCPDGSVIKIQAGFWGRRQRDLCRYVSIIDCGLKTIKNTTETLRNQCDGSTNCQVYASKNHFGNPCHGVYKYLEVNYTCVLKEDLGRTPCPEGWVRGNQNGVACYQLIQSKKTWSDAKETCHGYGAKLISIGGKTEQVLATSLMERAWNTDVWIGLSNEKSPKTYGWSDGSTVMWTNWGVGYPRGSWTGDHCVYMNLERTTKDLMYWRTGNCSLEKLFICKKVISPPNPSKPKTGVTSCLTGWTFFKNKCYRYYSYRRSWYSARSYCQRSYNYRVTGSLASIADEEENEFVKKLSNATIWIGLEGKGVFRGHVWSDDSPVSYANWDIGQPDSYNGREACTQLLADIGYWSDTNCYSWRPYVCKREITAGTSGPIPTVFPTYALSPRCKNGWILFNDMCYYISRNENSTYYKTWREAESRCRLEGGHLVSVTSSEEKDFLGQLTSKAPVYSFWIGLHDLNGESVYKWTDGTGYGKFIYWANGEPNNYHGQEDCIAMVKISGKWNDNHCSQKKSYICKSKTEDAPKIAVIQPATKVVKNGYCHSGWIGNGRFCYKFYSDQTDLKSWRDAKNACEEGTNSSAVGELLSITNELEQAFITMNVKGSNVPMWIGLNNLHNYRSYYWADSSPSNYFHWNRGHPEVTWRRCVEISPYKRDAGKWASNSCTKKNGYICKTAAFNAPPTMKPSTQKKTEPATFSCPDGFIRYDQSCYKFVNVPKTFDEAQKSCQKDNVAQLISIGSEFEQALLVFLLERNLGSVWIGLNRDPWSALKFTDYTAPLYSYWGPGQPNRALDQRTCVQANVTGFNVGRWDDVDCNTKNPYVCEIYHGETKITLEENSTCEAGWYKNQKFCYKYFPQSRSWAAARYECKKAGGNLVSIADEPEQDFVMFYFSNKPRTWVWIGLHDLGEAGGHEWSDKRPLTYVNWLEGQPNDPGQLQNCVLMDSRSGRWLDWRCSSSYSFICKRPLECTTVIPLKTDMIAATNSISANLSVDAAILDGDSTDNLAWCPNTTSGIKPRIQIDLSKLAKISSITIKGRVLDYRSSQFVRSFFVEYTRDGWKWQTVTRKGIDLRFFANNDGINAVTRAFDRPIVASSIAILPVVIEGQQPCMKVALRGCEFVCQAALGMNNWKILKNSITASSAKYPRNAPQNARPRDAGWCAQTNDDKQWIQVDFGRTNLVTKIRTYGAAHEDSYVKTYKIQFSADGKEWVDYKQHGSVRIFRGNIHPIHPTTHSLTDAFQAAFIRILPIFWQKNICMRFELFGCVADCDGPLVQRYDSNEVSLVKISSNDPNSNPEYARMDSGKAWCTSDTEGRYLEVDFGKRVRLKHIAVRGSPTNYGKPRRVVTYSLHIFRNKKWLKYMVDNSVKHIVSGNVNDSTALSEYTFPGKTNGIIVRNIRIYPEKFTPAGICMRVEFYGCLAEEEIVPSKPPKTQIYLLATVRITSMEWSDDYNDQTSQKFKRDSKTIREAVFNVYENSDDSQEGEALREVRVKKLRKGSIIADLELVFNPRFAKGENISKPLANAIGTGHLGSLTVDKSYFKIKEETKKSGRPRSGGNGNRMSTGMVAGIIVAVLLAVLLIVGIGIYWRQKRKRDLYGPKQFNNPILYSATHTDECEME